MDADTLVTYDDPKECIVALGSVQPVPAGYYEKTVNVSAGDAGLLGLVREAITHAKIWKRLGDDVTQPVRLQWKSQTEIVFLSEKIDGPDDMMPPTLLNAVKTYPSRAHELIVKTLQIVSHMVQKGVYHRDLHSNNVVVTRDFDVKIIDVGFAMIADEPVVGVENTPLYPISRSSSQDACILMRSIALSLHDPYHPYIDTYDRIMRRYERECSDRLPYLQKPAYWKDVPACVNNRHRDALRELYELKKNIGDSGLLDRYLGAFEWKTMIPEAILRVKEDILRERGINVQESKSNV